VPQKSRRNDPEERQKRLSRRGFRQCFTLAVIKDQHRIRAFDRGKTFQKFTQTRSLD
jgi:hypothetical protein